MWHCHVSYKTSFVSALRGVPFRLVGRHATDIQQVQIDVSAFVNRRLLARYLDGNVLGTYVTASLR